MNGPCPINEPIKSYRSGSSEKESIKKEIERLKSTQTEIPIIINGKDLHTNNTGYCVMPHNHKHILAKYHKAGIDEVNKAIISSLRAWKTWSITPIEIRIEIFDRAAQEYGKRIQRHFAHVQSGTRQLLILGPNDQS